MKKLTTNSKLIGCLMGLSIVALGTGCTDSDYDLSSVDSTIGVGGEGLELPTSSTENIILDDVLKLNNSDFVKIAANGDYMFNKDGDEATPSHPYINKIWVEKANVNNNFRLHITLPSQSAGARRAKLSNPVTAEGKLAEFHYTGAASNDIRELKEASVSSDVKISVAVSADLKRAVKTFKTLTLTVPSYMRLDLRQCSPSQPDYDAATGVVTFHNVSSTANIKLRAAVKTLDFQKPATTDNKLRFTPGQNGKDGQVDLNGVLNVGISFDEIDYAQGGGDLYLSANMSMGSITVHEATGKFDAEIKDLRADLSGPDKWTMTGQAMANVSMKGFTYKEEQKEYKVDGQGTYRRVNDVDVDGAGLGGFGMAFDFGATYKIDDDWTVSAALLDLGFIGWSNNMQAVNRQTSFEFNGFHDVAVKKEDAMGNPKDNSLESQGDRYADQIADFANLSSDGDKGSRSTGIGATMNFGCEYTLPAYRQLKFGFLSSTRINGKYSWTDARLSANVAPLSWLDGGMSFSVNSFTASMGWVINAHPKGFNFFIGMDHILGKTSKEFIPLSSNASLNLGMNVTF